MSTAEKVYWLKVVAALGVTVLTLTTQVYFNVSGVAAFMIGIIAYMGLSDVISNANGVERVRGLKIGLGVFLFTWMLTWILSYTIIQTMF